MRCGVGHRYGLDPALLWLWCRLAVVAPIRPLAWELPHASGVALKSKINKYKSLYFKEFILVKVCGFLFVCLFVLFFFRATPMAYRSSQARGLIGATAAGLCHRHSNAGSEPSL